MRKTLADKLTRLRELGGQMGGESEVVRKVVELLRDAKGATKLELVEETGAGVGYISALLNRMGQ